MRDLKCKNSSKQKYLEAIEVFLDAIEAESPDQLIDQHIQDMRSDDPRVRLGTQDRMNRFLDDYSKKFGINVLVRDRRYTQRLLSSSH